MTLETKLGMKRLTYALAFLSPQEEHLANEFMLGFVQSQLSDDLWQRYLDASVEKVKEERRERTNKHKSTITGKDAASGKDSE
jgi:hypothetical protein